ncbi:MAG: hypothetical protein WCC10_05440, partial [Tumebacillaceae bacterium]
MFSMPEMPRRRTIASQILLRTGIVLGVIALLTSVITYRVMTTELKEHLDEDVNSTMGMIANTLESTQQSSKIVEGVVGNQLYNASKAIANNLRGKTLDQIT